MIVKLMNISLTPNNSLGRLIYSFSCTVNEIDECIFSNYDKYNIQMIGTENYPDSKYFVKYGELHIPFPIATKTINNDSSTVETQGNRRRLLAASNTFATAKTVTSIENTQNYLPNSSG